MNTRVYVPSKGSALEKFHAIEALVNNLKDPAYFFGGNTPIHLWDLYRQARNHMDLYLATVGGLADRNEFKELKVDGNSKKRV